jgi:phospholipid transport system substrate-binding protein
MRWERRIVPLVFVVGVNLFQAPLRACAEAPTASIRETVDKVLAILKDQSVITRQERRKILREVIHARFDFTEMAKRSLGAIWRQRTPNEQQEFVEVFVELLKDAYLTQIESYGGEKILYLGETREGSYADVKTKIVSKKPAEFSVNYKLHLTNGEWKVYDVVVENISIVNNYRSQFSRIISKSSDEELLRKM